MRRKKIYENNMSTLKNSIKIDVVGLSTEFPEISIDKLANELVDNMFNVHQLEEDGTVYMVVDTTDENELIEEISNFIYANSLDIDDIDDIKNIVSSIIEESSLNESFDDSLDYDYYDDHDELNDFPPYDDDVQLKDCETMECSEDDELIDCETMECSEDEDFECYGESYRPNRTLRHRRVNEKRKGCCPPKRKRMVNLSESLKKSRRQFKANRLTESVIRNAMKKAMIENKHAMKKTMIENKHAMKKTMIENKQTNKKQSVLESIKNELGADKFNLIIKSIKSGKKHLYENKIINGKNINLYNSKELYDIMKKVQEQLNNLDLQLNALNESSSLREEILINEKIENKKKLLAILDEELTYRLSIKKLLKESDAEETNPEEDEEVELSRVVITLANQEAADELKSSMVDAGIPEDAIEIESDEDVEKTEEGTEEETSEEGTEETTEEGTSEEGTEEETSEETAESLYIKKFKKLLEDDEVTEEDDAAETEDTTEDEESEDEESEDEESEDEAGEENVKVILTNTDYINTLADVLDSEYGITKEEFEDMIGGEIVSEESDEEESDKEESDKEESDEESDDKKEEDKSSGDEAVDAMSPEELDKLFANA